MKPWRAPRVAIAAAAIAMFTSTATPPAWACDASEAGCAAAEQSVAASLAGETIIATYEKFVAAQNARDPKAIGAFFIDGPDFLWVSDGRSYWGRDAVLARMSGFQRAEVWAVTPDLRGARVVALSDDSAMLHLSLELAIGQADKPNTLPFLVSILWVKEDDRWRIASLLTTGDKTNR